MRMVPIPFAGTTAQPQSSGASLEILRNLYPEVNPESAKGPVTLYGTPGLISFATAGVGPVRGMCVMGGEIYVVSGDRLYVVDISGAAFDIGEIKGTGDAAMDTDGYHVGVASGPWLYAANKTEIIALPIVANGITVQDGMTLFTEAGTDRCWASDPDDMTTIGGTSFSTADAWPDAVKSCISDKRELVVFSERHSEVWQNIGATPFAFERGQGGTINRGCGASGSPTMVGGVVFWLGDDLGVYALNGYTPTRMSPPWIERMIAADTDPSAAKGWAYEQLGHTFYVLGFPGRTLVYDTTTGRWHTRKSQRHDEWRMRHHVSCFGKELVAGSDDGTIYELSATTYSDNGAEIERMAIAPPLAAGANQATMNSLFLEMDTGVGLNAGQGSSPLVGLDWTDDGGMTWSNRIYASAGAIGKYGQRVQWNRLGMFRTRSLRVVITDPVRVAIHGANAALEGRE